MVHIQILQLDQSLLDDLAVMGNKHHGSSDGLDEYGSPENPSQITTAGTTAARRAINVQS